MKSFLVIILVTTFLNGCRFKTNTFERANAIDRFGEALKVEYFRRIAGKPFQYKALPEFTITDKADVAEMVNEIKQANQPEPWKGAGWDKIVITYADTTILLHTDTRKIGLSASGTFYYLNKNNFITKRVSE